MSDIDVQIGREPEDIARLQRAFGDHHLLIFRGDGQITPERQVEITGWFGPVIAEGTAWTVLDNAEPAGRKELPFHSDITFLEFPLAGISLCPQELNQDTLQSFLDGCHVVSRFNGTGESTAQSLH